MSKKRLQSRYARGLFAGVPVAHLLTLGKAICESDARFIDLLFDICFDQRSEDLQNRVGQSLRPQMRNPGD